MSAKMESEYLTPAIMRDYAPSFERWARESAAYRDVVGARAQLDLAYGDEVRQRLDVFRPKGGARGPVAVFIHGGYWQAMDKALFSHMARGPNAHGFTVAIPNYTLCPDITVSGIVGELRNAVAFVARRFDRPITVYGHSAGGHLSACMIATDWRSVDPLLAVDTVHAALPISGIFQLEPLVATSLNEKLCLDVSEARRVSPLSWPAPAGKSVLAYVGGDESSEFLRQTRDLVAGWREQGVTATAMEVPGAGHFSVIEALADPDSSMTRDLVALAAGGRGDDRQRR